MNTSETKYAKAYKFGYRGIWFNLMLLILVFINGSYLYDRTIVVLKEQQTDYLLGSILIIAFLLETYLYPIKIRDILSHQHSKHRKRLKTLAFFLLIGGTTISFIALTIIAMSFGFNISESSYTAGLIGWITTIRFIYFWVSTSIMNSKTLKVRQISLQQTSIIDLGIAFFSSVYFVCIWQAMMLSKVDLNRFKGDYPSSSFELIGFSILVLLCLVPIRALYFLEEWQGKPGAIGVVAIIASLALLTLET